MEINDISSYVVFDDEFSSINSDKEIICIDALKFYNGIQQGKFHSLIKPTKPLLECVEKLTGITNGELNKCKQSVEDILWVFDVYVDKNPVVCNNLSFGKDVYEKYKDSLPNYFSAQIINIKEIAESIFVNEHFLTDSKMATLLNIDKDVQGVFLINKIFELLKKLIAAIGSTKVEIAIDKLNEIKKLDKISSLSLQKQFNWGYSKARIIMDYLSVCGFIKATR